MTSYVSNKVITDSVHGVVSLPSSKRKIIDSLEFQRLRWIRQLGLAHLVYPGCEHTRFTHSLGAYHVARCVWNHLEELADEQGVGFTPMDLTEDKRDAFLVAALCHDIGHTPFSHALENILLPQDMKNHEECTEFILTSDTDIHRRIDGICDIGQVIQLLNGKHVVTGLSDLISGPLNIDRADYLLRDARGSGVQYGFFDIAWLIHSVSLWKNNQRRLQLVLDGKRGLVGLRHYLVARQSMYQQVYFHKTVRGADRILRAIIERSMDPHSTNTKYDLKILPSPMREVLQSGGRPTIAQFLEIDDVSILSAIRLWSKDAKDPVLRYLANSLIVRKLPKVVSTHPGEIPAREKDRVSDAIRKVLKEKVLDIISIPNPDYIESALSYLMFEDVVPLGQHGNIGELYVDCAQESPLILDQLNQSKLYGYTPDIQALVNSKKSSIARLYVCADFERVALDVIGK